MVHLIVLRMVQIKTLQTVHLLRYRHGIFDSLGIVLSVVILLVVGVLPFGLMMIADALTGRGCMGYIILVGLILGLIYVFYQLLENILFELFIINLPY